MQKHDHDDSVDFDDLYARDVADAAERDRIKLRDEFAKAALPTLIEIASNKLSLLERHDQKASEWSAKNAYIYADAMLEARKKAP